MTEVVIAFRRPASMSAAELREWVNDLKLARRRGLAVSGAEGSENGLELRVEIDDGSVASAEEELVDLMTDMRLLGLRPAVVQQSRRRD